MTGITTSEKDLKEAAIWLEAYLQQKKVTLPVTVEEVPGLEIGRAHV